MKRIALCLSLCLPFIAIAEQAAPSVTFQSISRFQQQVWLSGTLGNIYRSTDDGNQWQKVQGPADSESLQFRDIQYLGDGLVFAMSAGEGSDSRMYRSTDDGKHWQLLQQGSAASTFYDCFTFTDKQHGWLYGDSDEQGLFILTTSDGGNNWQRITLPFAAQQHEGGFASGGTCLNEGKDGRIIVGTGNGETPRLLLLENGQWRSIDSPFPGGEAAGIFSVQQQGDWIYAFGGSLKSKDKPALAYRYYLPTDQWQAMPDVPLNGAIYGSALSPGHDVIWVSNPGGVAAWSPARRQWQKISSDNVWHLSCGANMQCVGVGAEQNISHLGP